MTDTEKIKLAEDLYNDPSTTQKEKALLEKLFPEIKPVYFLEIPAGDVAPAEEDGPLEEDIFPESSESEEDEEIIDGICGNLEYILQNNICAEQTKANLKNRIKWLIRLKSLCSLHHWKPSEEQMKALKEAVDEHWEADGLHPLYTLYDDLQNYFSHEQIH